MRRNAQLQPLVPFHGSNVQSKRCPLYLPMLVLQKLGVIKNMHFKDIEISWNSICKMKGTFTERTRSSPFFGGFKIPKMRFMQTPPEIPLIQPEMQQQYLFTHPFSVWNLSAWYLTKQTKSLVHKNVLVQLPWCGCCKKYITQLVLNLPEPTRRPARLTCSAMIFLGIYDIYVKTNMLNAVPILGGFPIKSWQRSCTVSIVNQRNQSLKPATCIKGLSLRLLCLRQRSFIFPATFRMTPKVSKIIKAWESPKITSPIFPNLQGLLAYQQTKAHRCPVQPGRCWWFMLMLQKSSDHQLAIDIISCK